MGNQLTIRGPWLKQSQIQSLIDAQTFLNAINGYVFIDPVQYHSAAQGTWSFSIDANYYHNGLITNTTSALNDNITYLVGLAKGTYSLKILGATAANKGIAKIYLDDDLVATFDLYSPTTIRNVSFTQTGIINSTPGLKSLKFKMESKNASSSGYNINLSQIILYRTA